MSSLYALKPWYTARLDPVLSIAVKSRTSPDVFTALGVVAALTAGLAIASGCWVGAAVLLALRLAGANLDGALARARGVSRPWGFVLNELGDRASDLAMFAGLVALAWRLDDQTAVLALTFTTLAATLPTFASLSVAAAGGTRANGGPLGKTERCLLVVIATAFPSSLLWVSAVIGVGSLLTAALRLQSGHRSLA